MITQQTIDKIFSTVRVEEIVGEYVQLKRSGSTYKGLSPFQDEKTPSFIVSPSKQIWKDFSTGKGGTAISFLMEIENFTYPEALRYAAKKYGIDVEETKVEQTEEQKQTQSEREQLYKIHEVANNFFQEQLYETEEGKMIGLSYFKERELREDIIKKFQLGYSPEKKNAFTEYALNKGYSKEILEKSGLSVFTEYHPNGVDRFRERVIFPIHSFSGRVLGFGGRILKNNTKLAKYLNSPETDIYHKSNILYGLNQSKQAISKQDFCILVEGYMDVIALHQNGVENVVASSGTSLTDEQIRLIKRLTENVTIIFDGDNAGIKASFRSIDLLLAQSMNIRVLLLPDGDDPDSFSRKHNKEYVEEYIKTHATDFINFKAEILLSDVENDPIRKAEAIRDIVKSVAFVSNHLKREVYLKEVANKFGLSEQSLFNELNIQKNIVQQQKTPNATSPKKLEVIKAEPEFENRLSYVMELMLQEENLLSLLLKYGNQIIKLRNEENQPYETTVIEEILAYFKEDEYEIRSPLIKKIISQIEEGIQNKELRTGEFFLKLMDADISTKITDTLINPHENSNWTKHNIYFRTEEEVVAKIVEDVMARHKKAFVVHSIYDLKSQLNQDKDNTEIYLKISKLIQLKNRIDEVFGRIV